MKTIWVACVALLCAAGLLAAGPVFDCDFACDAAGSANQAVCAPVAAHLHLIYEPGQAAGGNSLVTVKFTAGNGTRVTGLTLWFVDRPVWHSPASIHSNGGSQSWEIDGAPDLLGSQLIVLGLGGIDEEKSFTAMCCSDDGGGAPTPEPGTMLSAALGLAWVARRLAG